jgi:hypothetical protein
MAQPPTNRPQPPTNRPQPPTMKTCTDSSRFMTMKSDGTPFKGVRREKAMDVINKLKDR